MNENISQYLLKFLDNPDPQYAVMLKGKWGCGKSFFIKNWLDKHKERYNKGEATLEPIYVSLYGLKELSQVTAAIDRALYPYLYSKGAKLTKKILGVAGKIVFRTNFDCNDNGSDDFSIDATLDSLSLLGTKTDSSIIKTKLIVFDDLERCLIDMKLLLGYINNFVEHGACHVIIIGDETHTTKDSQQKLIEFKEKTVGREFEIVPDIRAAIDCFLENDILKCEWINNHKGFVFDCFKSTECDNLRLLRQCLYDFSVLYSEIDCALIKEASPYMLSILGEYIITYCEYRNENRELLKGYKWTYFSGIFGDEETKNKVSKFQSKYSSIIERYKVDVLDYDCIKQIIREIETGCSIKYYVEGLLRQRQGNMSVQDKLTDFINLSEEEFKCVYNQLNRDLTENNVVDQYLIGRTLALFLFFDYNQIRRISKKTILVIKRTMVAYYQAIDDKELLFRERNAFYRGVRSYGKFSEYPLGEEFLGFYVKMFEKRESELKNLMEKTLLSLDDNNVDKLISLSSETLPNRHFTYKQTSIFKNIDSKIFTNRVLQLNNNSLYTLCMFFSQHYEFNCRLSNIPNYYTDDLLTLKQVYEIAKKELSNIGTIRRYVLKYFLKYLNGAIERAGGNTDPIQIKDFVL